MEKWIAKLKQLPRWAWWVGGAAIGLVALLVIRARRTVPVTVSEQPQSPAPSWGGGGGAAPVDTAPPSTPPAGGRQPDRNGAIPSWWESAMAGLMDRNRELELEVGRLSAQAVAENRTGMGTAVNRSTIAGHPTPFDLAVELAEEDKLTSEAATLLASMTDPASGYYSANGKFYDPATHKEITRAEAALRVGEGYPDPITGAQIGAGGTQDVAESRAEYDSYFVTTYRRPDGTTYTQQEPKPVTTGGGAPLGTTVQPAAI